MAIRDDMIEAVERALAQDWTRAHEAAQADPGQPAAWVHAHLHRIEGDLENAGYWYALAGKPVATGPLDREWEEIATGLLDPAVVDRP
ncbi:MAG: hypothetical protein H7Z10_14755 [Gemmatimonadaceae bacterium]|nr:hypothetical protein [Acetobacteraceae bacterium]